MKSTPEAPRNIEIIIETNNSVEHDLLNLAHFAPLLGPSGLEERMRDEILIAHREFREDQSYIGDNRSVANNWRNLISRADYASTVTARRSSNFRPYYDTGNGAVPFYPRLEFLGEIATIMGLLAPAEWKDVAGRFGVGPDHIKDLTHLSERFDFIEPLGRRAERKLSEEEKEELYRQQTLQALTEVAPFTGVMKNYQGHPAVAVGGILASGITALATAYGARLLADYQAATSGVRATDMAGYRNRLKSFGLNPSDDEWNKRIKFAKDVHGYVENRLHRVHRDGVSLVEEDLREMEYIIAFDYMIAGAYTEMASMLAPEAFTEPVPEQSPAVREEIPAPPSAEASVGQKVLALEKKQQTEHQVSSLCQEAQSVAHAESSFRQAWQVSQKQIKSKGLDEVRRLLVKGYSKFNGKVRMDGISKSKATVLIGVVEKINSVGEQVGDIAQLQSRIEEALQTEEQLKQQVADIKRKGTQLTNGHRERLDQAIPEIFTLREAVDMIKDHWQSLKPLVKEKWPNGSKVVERIEKSLSLDTSRSIAA